MNSVVIAVAVLFAVVVADGRYGAGYGHGGHRYHGHYNNKCGADGFYYKDSTSFVICSNGNAYVQPCAPGSRNSGNYHTGGYYYAHHFCDVNLVDHGYGAHHGYGHGHSHGGRGYNNNHGYYGGSYGRNHYGYQNNHY